MNECLFAYLHVTCTVNSSENTSSSSKPSKFGVKKAGMDIFKSLFNFLTLAMKPQDLQSQEFGGGGFGGQEQVQLLDIFNSPSSSLTSEKTAGSPNLSVAGADLKVRGGRGKIEGKHILTP